jgi:soluble lytic murein transglycosylase-like protein
VGESGCGKSTTGRSLLRLVQTQGGEIEFEGQHIGKLQGPALQSLRRNIQFIFQDPFASLDPRLTVGYSIIEPLLIHKTMPPKEAEQRMLWLLDKVGLPREAAQRYPHEFSGGQRQRICIARALALFELGLRSDASQEWNWTVQAFSDAQLLAAAELARRMEWYDRAINTAERTRELHDFELRFLAPYRELAQKAARENELDEAWVFGLMRQESRFINVARSGVGASGLMQIMPATARWIAKRLGIKRFHPREMQDPAKNIQFGAYYLKHVQTSLDGSPVLATAAYNAGPGRAQRWRGTRPMEAAVYIESIPFAETRDYVKKVMSNAMYYAARFGQPSVLLTERLGTVPPRKAPADSAPGPDAALEIEQPGD